MIEMEEKKKKMGNVPNLRFPEFEGEWVEILLRDFVKKVNTKNTNNEINVVFSNSATQGIILQNEYFDKDIANKDNLNGYYIVAPDDFVYNPRLSSNAEVGAMSVNHTKQTGLVSPLYTVFRVNANTQYVYISFLEYIFKSKVWHNYIRSIANCGARDDRMNIKNEDLFALPLFMPQNKEQQKIASFLSLIDSRISTQRKIIKELETLILGISNLLFSGEKYLFSKSDLRSLCTIKKGEQINSSELSDCGDYYVMNGGIVSSGYHKEYNSEADTISISEGGNSCGYVQYNTSKFWSGGHCYTLNEIDTKITNKYLYYYLKDQEQNIMALRIGSGLPNIQKKELEKFEIQYSSLENQQEIVNILDSLTNKIKNEQKILSTYQQQKKYLLSQMFI